MLLGSSLQFQDLRHASIPWHAFRILPISACFHDSSLPQYLACFQEPVYAMLLLQDPWHSSRILVILPRSFAFSRILSIAYYMYILYICYICSPNISALSHGSSEVLAIFPGSSASSRGLPRSVGCLRKPLLIIKLPSDLFLLTTYGSLAAAWKRARWEPRRFLPVIGTESRGLPAALTASKKVLTPGWN